MYRYLSIVFLLAAALGVGVSARASMSAPKPTALQGENRVWEFLQSEQGNVGVKHSLSVELHLEKLDLGTAIASGCPLASKGAVANSGPIARSLGAASRAEMLARKLKLNIRSPTTRQLLNSLDDKVVDFIGKYRMGGIKGKFPSEFLDKSVEQALRDGGSTVRKLLLDGRFVK